MNQNRRDFLKHLGFATAGMGLLPGLTTESEAAERDKKLFFTISLAEWSLHGSLVSGKITNLDFPGIAKNTYGISAVEYVDQFFKDKATDQQYLIELKKRSSDLGVRNVLIMIDTAGHLAELDDAKRKVSVENHYKWVDAAKFLGCHSIRVNAHGTGSAADVAKAAVDGLGLLSEYGAKNKIGVIVENHGGYSSDGKWLSDVMKQVNNPYCGTLPDFGNFCVSSDYGHVDDNSCTNEYDKYQGVAEMMPFAKGVSAKTFNFDAQGNDTETDYKRMMAIVKKAGYKGFVGVEYEGKRLSEEEGIRATKKLLERVGQALS